MVIVKIRKPTLVNHTMIRVRTYTIEEIFSYVEKLSPGELYYQTEEYKLKLRRAIAFHKIGLVCVNPYCKQAGSFFALQFQKITNKKRLDQPEIHYHLDLFGITKDGKEILMTLDHRLPKSLGGKDHVDNYDPMCKVCNETKGNDQTWNK